MAVSGYSGFYNGVVAIPYTGARNARYFVQDLTVNRIYRRLGARPLKALMATLIGTAPGPVATAQHKRVAAPAVGPVTNLNALGGRRQIETFTQLNRATTATDVTRLKKIFSETGSVPRKRGDRFGRDIPHTPAAI